MWLVVYRVISKAKVVLDLPLSLHPIVHFMARLVASRLEKLVGSLADDVGQAANDAVRCVRSQPEDFRLLFGWIRFHIDFNFLPIPAFREGDCSAFANNPASSDILPPPISARVKTTSVYSIASCGSRPAMRF